MSKVCNKCKIEKPLSDFYNDGNRARAECKKCTSDARKVHYAKNAEKIKKYNHELYAKKADSIKEQKKAYYQINKNKIANYRRVNKVKLNTYNVCYKQSRKKTDLLFKFVCAVRSLTNGAFKRSRTYAWKKQTKTEALLGCTIKQLKEHLAKQFLPGMSLENHGEWHIDHIIPLASAKTQAEIEALCHYTNLQPLWAEDNFKKGKSFTAQTPVEELNK